MVFSSSYHVILNTLKSDNGLWFASNNENYKRVWLRDSAWMLMPYILVDNHNEIKKALYGFFGIIRQYKHKLIDGDASFRLPPCYHRDNTPSVVHDYKTGYDASRQNDVIGAWLWIISKIWQRGLYSFSPEELELIQDMVMYLGKIKYWQDKDSGYWEEESDVRASSIGICLSGLLSIERYVVVPDFLIVEGDRAIRQLGHRETPSRYPDAAQLSLIWPFAIYDTVTTNKVLSDIMLQLNREHGCIRYLGDQYYSLYGREMEWSLLQLQLSIIGCPVVISEKIANNNYPEGFYGGTATANPNTPLGWCVAMAWLHELFIGNSLL